MHLVSIFWSFIGPLEWTSEGWNRTWFYPVPAAKQKYGDREHAIYATSWEKTRDGSFPLSWDPDDNSVKGIDVTEHYKNVEIKVYSWESRPALGHTIYVFKLSDGKAEISNLVHEEILSNCKLLSYVEQRCKQKFTLFTLWNVCDMLILRVRVSKNDYVWSAKRPQ